MHSLHMFHRPYPMQGTHTRSCSVLPVLSVVVPLFGQTNQSMYPSLPLRTSLNQVSGLD